jgi:hypothetical protein
MVRAEVADPAPGVIVAGENEQARVLGRPAQESEIGVFEAPDCIFAVTVKLADFPAGIVIAFTEAPKEMAIGVGDDGGVVAAQVGM